MKRETTVGLIVNASASRDVRRLTSLARTIDVHERVNAIARVLRGLAAARVRTVLFMPEPAHVVERAVDTLAAAGFSLDDRAGLQLRAVVLPNGPEALDAAGTTDAAAAMAEAGAACLVTIGGDGTNRAVARGWPSALMVPLPGGTNNAFCTPIDPTAAGLAAGIYAFDPERYAAHVRQAPRLEIRVDGRLEATAIALVDVALVRSGWVGAHALWDPALLVEAVVARSDPALTGLAGLGGMISPLDAEPPRALHVRFGPTGSTVTAPLGPGQLVPVGIRDWRVLALGESVELGGPVPAAGRPAPGRRLPSSSDEDGWLTLAFDGEREVVLEPGARAGVRLAADGPRVLDAHGVLQVAARRGTFAGTGER
ncbi:MAG: hypothetical protein AABZ33_02140 [Chloroflexota bacterium]